MATTGEDATLAQLRELAAFAAVLEAPDFELGHWVPMEQRPDGVYTMPWFEFSAAARELLRAMPVSPQVRWMDWSQTDEAKRLLADPAAVAVATAEQLVALATTIVRGDRFSEGTVAHLSLIHI